MKKFSFRLQAVLDVRQKELEQKQQEMASIVKRLNEQIDELEQIYLQESQTLASLEDICSSPMLDVATISSSNGYLLKLSQDAKKQLRVIENTKLILKAKQQEISEIYKKVKVLEKLKEKQEEEYYKNIETKLAKEIDDMVTTRYKVS